MSAADHLLAARQATLGLEHDRAAECLRDARHTLGWTQREMADRFGVSQATWQRLESGQQTPTYEQLERIRRLACQLQEDDDE